MTYRCSNCGLDFYGEALPEGVDQEKITDDQIIDDEEALRAAEEEIERQVKEVQDRRRW